MLSGTPGSVLIQVTKGASMSDRFIMKGSAENESRWLRTFGSMFFSASLIYMRLGCRALQLGGKIITKIERLSGIFGVETGFGPYPSIILCGSPSYFFMPLLSLPLYHTFQEPVALVDFLHIHAKNPD
jgi:hypothetical protein